MCSQKIKLVNLVTPKETVCIERLFKMIDANDDGELTSEEIVNALFKLMGKKYTEAQIKEASLKFIHVSDKNSNGTIDLDEFMCYLAKKFNEKDSDSKLREVFAFFDEDNNNEISHDELKKALNQLGGNYTDRQIAKMIRKIDTNGDGSINFEEFKQMMTGNHFY